MNTKTILVVDDDVKILDLLDQLLSPHGFSVIKASSENEALTLLDAASPDLLILDIVLADTTGGELYRKIQQQTRRKDIPVIFLTGLITPSEHKSHIAINIGNVPHETIGKPFQFSELLSAIEQLLQK